LVTAVKKSGLVRGLHGGRVFEAARRWNVDPADVIDFSSNINPLGPPQHVLTAIESSLHPSRLRAYPDPHSFVEAVSQRHGLMTGEIVVGSGVASLLFATMQAIQPGRVLILEPAFAEYARASVAARASVTKWQLTDHNCFAPDFDALAQSVEAQQFDLIVLNSPHNPSGNLYARADLLLLLDVAERTNTFVLLDEAFVDYVPECSLVTLAATRANLVVLRSLTKFHAFPGLRVGYAVCGKELAKAIAKQIDPWSVSTVALEAARATLKEDSFDERTCALNASAREEFGNALGEARVQVYPSVTNFLLAKLPHGSASALAQWLESEHILIRLCDSFAGLTDKHVRLAVRSSEDNLRLAALIQSWLRKT
jgi:threonine-phosphate decarboxylase